MKAISRKGAMKNA